jgi:hypothetical protein
MSDTEEPVQLVVKEIYDPLDDPQFRCDVCKMNFFKRYMSLNGNKKAVERHMTTKTHKHNVERAAQGLPPERPCNFMNMHSKMQELVDKMSFRIEELETLVKAVADGNSCDELENSSNECSTNEPRHRTEPQSQWEQEEQSSPQTRQHHHQSSLLSEQERSVLYDYDGEKLANMRAVRAILTRLLQQLGQVSCGEKYERNFQFVNRTLNALTLQLERFRGGYECDEDETDQIACRLIQIAQHGF